MYRLEVYKNSVIVFEFIEKDIKDIFSSIHKLEKKFSEKDGYKMKAKLEFILPEERDQLLLTIKGPTYYSMLWNFDSDLKKLLESENLNKDQLSIVKEINQEFDEWLECYNINLDEVD